MSTLHLFIRRTPRTHTHTHSQFHVPERFLRWRPTWMYQGCRIVSTTRRILFVMGVAAMSAADATTCQECIDAGKFGEVVLVRPNLPLGAQDRAGRWRCYHWTHDLRLILGHSQRPSLHNRRAFPKDAHRLGLSHHVVFMHLAAEAWRSLWSCSHAAGVQQQRLAYAKMSGGMRVGNTSVVM